MAGEDGVEMCKHPEATEAPAPEGSEADAM